MHLRRLQGRGKYPAWPDLMNNFVPFHLLTIGGRSPSSLHIMSKFVLFTGRLDLNLKVAHEVDPGGYNKGCNIKRGQTQNR